MASEIAKTEAKRLSEDVAEDIEDAETDDPVAGGARTEWNCTTDRHASGQACRGKGTSPSAEVDGYTQRDRPAKAERGRKKCAGGESSVAAQP